ncbi:MAG: GNAT family N-acetyltransferase [Ferruginibacter sp.]
MADYRIKRIGAGDFSILIPLMKDCFGQDVDVNYFHWKYIDNPAGHFIGFIAIEPTTNEIGAYYGVVPQNFIIDGKERTIYQSCDTMTHSKHRRLGLFKMLALECFRYLKEENRFFIIGFGGSQSTPGFLKFGWRQVFHFRYYFKHSIFCQAARVRSFSSGTFREETDLNKLQILLDKLKQPAAIHTRRNVQHISWRTKNPNYSYKTVTYSEADIIEGYVIYYVLNGKLILFDFIFDTKKSEKGLLWYLSKEVVKNNYEGIIAFCQEKGEQAKLLQSNRFIKNPFKKGPLSEKTPFIFFASDEEMNKFSEQDKWQITGYDHDAL